MPRRTLGSLDRDVPGEAFGDHNVVKSWSHVFRSPTTQQWRKKSIGNYPTVGLNHAKELAADCLTQVRASKDPLDPPPLPVSTTFKTLAEEYQTAHRKRHSGVWGQEVERMLKVDILPDLALFRLFDADSARGRTQRLFEDLSKSLAAILPPTGDLQHIGATAVPAASRKVIWIT